MKKLLVSVALGLCLTSFQQNPGEYTINGKIKGNSDGKKVYLYTKLDVAQPVVLDSTVIKDGEFSFKGRLTEPERVRIIIDNNPSDKKMSPRGLLASIFYLENSSIDYIAHIDSMPGYYYNPQKAVSAPVVKGSKVEDLYQNFRNYKKDLSKEIGDLDNEYLQKYHRPALKDTFNTEIGIKLIKKIDAAKAKSDEQTLNFIKQNPASVVSYDLGKLFFLDMFVTLNTKQIDELIATLEPAWKGTKKFNELKSMADKARLITVGSKYIDVKVLNMNNVKVNLSKYIKPGKYTLLEFWASWCGPCRGEIPHLKHVYKQYKDKNFDIVSISFDDKKTEWQITMKKENMTWTQLYDPKHFEGESAKTYNITGIPYSILISPEGRIVGVDMRGARLDAVLQEACKIK